MRKALIIITLVLVILINISIYTNYATLFIPLLSVLLICCVVLFINETVNEQRKVDRIKSEYDSLWNKYNNVINEFNDLYKHD